MYVYRTEREFENARASNQARKDQGIEFIELDAGEIRELEPAIKLPFVKGLLFDKASHVLNPQSLVTSYFDCFLSNQGTYIKQSVISIDHKKDSLNVA